MDPQRAWLDLLDAISQGDFEDAVAIATDLQEWLRKGGFPPTVAPQLEPAASADGSVARILQHELALHACAFVLSLD